ncbi:MAG TPA: DUF305 domain-containing protein [Gemmatimonadaceae bacterium]|nr:DUF305 domain-containing protein [Gemmatimonadaceae bacterium]HRQ78064.1 DUF305 domain-containing protein [Gemmatimonadaceae bacterium]
MPMLRTASLLALAGAVACATPPAETTPSPASAVDEHAGHAMPAADAHAGHAMPAAQPDAHAGHVMHDLPPVTLPPGSLVTEADVRFMQMMIGHHAQAVYMTRLAEHAGASDRVLKLAHKIDLSQAGEIALMQGWLVDYKQHAPDTESWRRMSMPGMLTAAQLEQLSAARGRDFDRLFLELMIKHHEGAVQMVAELLNSPRAAQEVDINVLANEIEAAQLAEIELMWQMLAELR